MKKALLALSVVGALSPVAALANSTAWKVVDNTDGGFNGSLSVVCGGSLAESGSCNNNTVILGDLVQGESDGSTMDVWEQGHGATVTDSEGHSADLASYGDVKDNRNAINDNTEWDHRQESQIEFNSDVLSAHQLDLDNLYATKMDKYEFEGFKAYQWGVDAHQNKRLGILSGKVQDLYGHVNRLDGMIAAQQAANSLVVPSDFNGDISFSLGWGGYRGHNGLAAGLLHDGGSYAVKATVSGTDADNWKDLAYGASVNFTF